MPYLAQDSKGMSAKGRLHSDLSSNRLACSVYLTDTAHSLFLHFSSFLPGVSNLGWGIILKPQPPHTKQNYEQHVAAKLSNLPCFKAFGVIFCPDFCSYFALYGWVGVTRAFLNGLDTTVYRTMDNNFCAVSLGAC